MTMTSSSFDVALDLVLGGAIGFCIFGLLALYLTWSDK